MVKGKEFDHGKYQNWCDPHDVVPYEKNAKIHTEKQIDNICNSIRRFGWQQDTVITSDNVLVIGHGRRLAAQKLGCDMPYHVIDKTADELTENDIRELRIADNQTNAETGFDFAMLEIDTEDLEFEGFDFDFMNEAPSMMDFMNDEYGIAGESNKLGTVTFTFESPDEAEEVKSYVRKNDQIGITKQILEYVRNNNA